MTDTPEAIAAELDRQNLHRSLTNQTPSPDVITTIEALREKAKELGDMILEECPRTRERSLAVTHLDETVMWAVKALVLL